jgi:branched-chain amino acid transport system ATP-binding protein
VSRAVHATEHGRALTEISSSLRLKDVAAGYRGRDVVFGVSLEARQGALVALFGPNGAGKSTTLKAAAGLLPLSDGSVVYDGVDVTQALARRRVGRGLVYLPQQQATFATLSVKENLLMGAVEVRSPRVRAERLDRVVDLFPRLGQRLRQVAGTMSGGEQRMVSIGIALMAGARMLLLDEPSLGLAPVLYENLLTSVRRLVDEGSVGVILVEQAIGPSLRFVDHVWVMRSGILVADYTGDAARTRDDWWQLF